jgi:hypothetical protein
VNGVLKKGQKGTEKKKQKKSVTTDEETKREGNQNTMDENIFPNIMLRVSE